MSKKQWTDASVHLQKLLHSNASPTAVQKARDAMEAAQRSYWQKAKALARAVLDGETTIEKACEASGVTPEDLGEAFRMLSADIPPPMADPDEEDDKDASDTGSAPGPPGTTPPRGSDVPGQSDPPGAEPPASATDSAGGARVRKGGP